MDVVVCGYICLDIIPHWTGGGIEMLVPGHILEMSGVDISTGGAVANTGLTLYRLGIETSLLGKIGNDIFGKIILELLQGQNTEITNNMIISNNDESSYTVVLNPPDTDRIFLNYPGSNHTFNANEISYTDIEGARLFHFGYPPAMKRFYQNDGEELIKMFSKVRNMGMVTSLDMVMVDPESPSGQINWKKFLSNVLPYVDIFVPSIDELLYMWNKEDYQLLAAGKKKLTLDWLSKLSDELIEGGVTISAIKLGNKGLFLKTGIIEGKNLCSLISKKQWSRRQLFSPVYKVDVAGTTGAGDTTIAGFLSQIIEGSKPEEAINIGTATGAHCVEYMDATSGIKTIVEIRERMNKGWEKANPSLCTEGWGYNAECQLWEKIISK
ncbi:MAG: carbohydrate kinase family protein [Atribacterota bacterium]